MARETLNDYFNSKEFGDLGKAFSQFVQSQLTQEPKDSPLGTGVPASQVETSTRGIIGRDIAPFYQDPMTGITIIEERKADANGQKLSTRDFTIDQGYFKLKASVNTSFTKLEDKRLTLSFRRNLDISLTRGSLEGLIHTLPDLLYPQLLTPEAKAEEPEVEPKVLVNKTDNHSSYHELKEEIDAKQLDEALAEWTKLQSVSLLFPRSEGREAGKITISNMVYPFDRATIQVEFPLSYTWNEQLLEWIIHNHFDGDSLEGQSAQADNLAEVVNYVSQQMIADHYNTK